MTKLEQDLRLSVVLGCMAKAVEYSSRADVAKAAGNASLAWVLIEAAQEQLDEAEALRKAMVQS